MIAVNPLHAATAAHRAAYDAFQVAPDGEKSEEACCAMVDALDALVVAACAFPILTRPLPEGAGALLAHIRWWLAEEAVHAEDYQPNYGILLGRAADMAAVLNCEDADPVFAALAEVEAADRRAARVLAETADDDGPEANARFEAEDRRRDAKEKALSATMPTTLAGLAALVRRYAAVASDPDSDGLTHLAQALAGVRSPIILPAGPEPDPILALITAADAAGAAHAAACRGLDEDDDAQMRACNQAAADAHDALTAVRRAMPGTVAGLHELAAFYIRDAALYDRDREHVEHLAAALQACESTGRFSSIWRQNYKQEQPLEGTIRADGNRPCLGVPGQAQVETAWHALPAETKDRIGIIATDMVFQGFVHGDDCVVADQPESRPVPGDTDAAHAIRNAAEAAGNARLSELYRVIEAEIPGLFGPEGQNPDWAVAMGALR